MSKTLFFFSLVTACIILFIGGVCKRVPSDLGVFKSEDGGESWHQKVTIKKKKTIKNVEVLTLKIDPVNPNNLYIGTKGKGVYKSSDGAESWQQTSLSVGDVYAIDIDPKDTGIIYVGGYFGTLGKIYKSTNGGEDFEEIYSETHKKIPVRALAIDWYDTRKIYAGTKAGALLKSEDSGRSWLVKKWVDDEIVQIAISFYDSRHVFVGAATKGLYKTENEGETWKDLSENLKNFSGSNQVHSIAVSRQNPKMVYLGSTYGLLVSEDEGKSWKSIKLLVKLEKTSILKIALAQDPKTIYLGIDSAVYKTTDGGISWSVKKITSQAIITISCDFQNSQIVYAGIKKKGK